RTAAGHTLGSNRAQHFPGITISETWSGDSPRRTWRQHARTWPRGNVWETVGYTRTSWLRSSRRLYCTPRTTSPLSRSMALAHTGASRASARG
ncbi:unnamed protein product, partial [Ectocarpus fasciculatus]